MNFEPGLPLKEPANLPACWLLFQEGSLLVETSGQTVQIPEGYDLVRLGFLPHQAVYIGKLNSRPCYAAEIGDSVLPQRDAGSSSQPVFLGLRDLIQKLPEEVFYAASYGSQILRWDRTHRFCGRCGGLTERQQDERAARCPRCGLVQFPRISPAVIVSVVRGDNILLVRAHRHPLCGEPTMAVSEFVDDRLYRRLCKW